MSSSRPILKLPKKQVEQEGTNDDISVPVGIYDLLLPSRRYDVHHKVAVLGEVSLTTEFLLRLLYSVDGMSEKDVARFFDFNHVEMAFVINEVEARAYISREEGRLWLTDAGYALFKESGRPQIFEVQKRKEKVGFDLLSLAPSDWERLSEFECALPELEIRDAELAATASKRVPESFRRFYGELSSKRDRDIADSVKRTLYSIDEVVPGDRFSSVVPFVAMANTRRPADPEPALEAWRSAHEIVERGPVVHGVAAFLDRLKVEKSLEDSLAFQVLLDAAPEYLKEFTTRNGLSVQRYFREIATRAGELRSDRPTIGLIGPLYLPDNRKRIGAALNAAAPREQGNDDSIFWVTPLLNSWGASRALGTFLDGVKYDSIAQADGTAVSERNVFAIAYDQLPRHLTLTFQNVLLRSKNGSLPSNLEIMLVPQRVIAITVHAPLLEGRGFPIPLGILSFDPKVVRRTHQYLETQLAALLKVHRSDEKYNLREALHWKRQPEPKSDQGE
jgi:hypothetical protein